ncbi:hypothetical protein LOAG_00853 [Loa loa]|uniref:Uncharacterized protein n=1 Tax=Loa loa TaxID=7209 RepID=A0A1I7VWZ8_LOALO|nr:hypothetical protein LOAG_00853 [Loa loa]EFO27636.1 hypothetical protein LOAG_00853 [Loa loa]
MRNNKFLKNKSCEYSQEPNTSKNTINLRKRWKSFCKAKQLSCFEDYKLDMCQLLYNIEIESTGETQKSISVAVLKRRQKNITPREIAWTAKIGELTDKKIA